MSIGAFISSETVVKNYQLVSDKIISKVRGYIKSFKVLSSKESKGVMTVKISAVVKESNLKGDLELIRTTLERMNYPKVVIMIAEQNVGATMFSFWWGNVSTMQNNINDAEMALSSELMSKNFKIVDRGSLTGTVKVKNSQQIVDISNQHALEMTKNVDADIVILDKIK